MCLLFPLCHMWINVPLLQRGFGAKGPKMVLGYNLHHMAPFGILEAGFCMVFRCASFWFWAPGVHFGTPDPNFGPGICPSWPGKVLGPKMGVGKKWFSLGMVPKLEIRGFPATRMDCMVPRRPLGKPISPQNLPENSFIGIPQFPEKTWAPGQSPIGPSMELL